MDLLENLHSKGVVHGNLKPSKILTDLDYKHSDTLYLNGLDKAEVINKQIMSLGTEKRVNLRVKLEHHKFTSLAAHYGYRKPLDWTKVYLSFSN